MEKLTLWEAVYNGHQSSRWTEWTEQQGQGSTKKAGSSGNGQKSLQRQEQGIKQNQKMGSEKLDK